MPLSYLNNYKEERQCSRIIANDLGFRPLPEYEHLAVIEHSKDGYITITRQL